MVIERCLQGTYSANLCDHEPCVSHAKGDIVYVQLKVALNDCLIYAMRVVAEAVFRWKAIIQFLVQRVRVS